jgi:hypothetical protein
MREYCVSNRRFATALSALLLLYLGVEIVYIIRFPLVMDEFGEAGVVFRMRELIPYRDFVPYKTVLGYYIQFPILMLPFRTWTLLLLTKVEMALITATALGYAVWLLRDRIDRRALLAALALLLAMSTFLERSAELRVDMMTGLAGLLSLVFLLRKQPLASGVLAAVSFLMSQKGAFYVIATAVALLYLLIVVRERTRETLRFGVAWSAAAATILILYIAAWSLSAGSTAVVRPTFVSAARVAGMTDYSDIRLHYWAQTLERNPFFYALFVAAVAALFRKGLQNRDQQDNLLAAYGATIAVQSAMYQQPWPYFFVVVLPVALIVHARFFDHFLHSALWLHHRNACLLLYFAGGIVLPLSRLSTTLRRDSALQKRTVEVAECILQPSDRYLAAVDILFRHRQSVDELAWVDRIAWASLYKMTPAATTELIRRIHATPTKLFLYNYRTALLPPPLLLYLRTEFDHLWGNIFIYAPRMAPGVFDLKFDGHYLVESRQPSIIIDGVPITNGTRMHLKRGPHRYEGKQVARLKLQPPCVPQNPAPPAEFFPDVYDF